jgi:hypothetical protein
VLHAKRKWFQVTWSSARSPTGMHGLNMAFKVAGYAVVASCMVPSDLEFSSFTNRHARFEHGIQSRWLYHRRFPRCLLGQRRSSRFDGSRSGSLIEAKTSERPFTRPPRLPIAKPPQRGRRSPAYAFGFPQSLRCCPFGLELPSSP